MKTLSSRRLRKEVPDRIIKARPDSLSARNTVLLPLPYSSHGRYVRAHIRDGFFSSHVDADLFLVPTLVDCGNPAFFCHSFS